jgi:hypothetical protein
MPWNPTIRYLFDSKGIWIASQSGWNVFSRDGKWIGWVQEEDQAVITPGDQYLGSIVNENRLYYKVDYRGDCLMHKKPGTGPLGIMTDYPGQAGVEDPPPGFQDIAKNIRWKPASALSS